MNERRKTNSLLSVKNSIEVTHRDVAVSTDSGIRLNDGQTSHRRRSTILSGKPTSLTFEENKNLEQAVAYLHADNALLDAADLGNDKYIETLLSLKTTNIHQLDYLGRNALHFAVWSGNERAIKLLLDAGVSPNVKDQMGTTPLSLCLMRQPSLRIANLLFDYGATILQRSNPMDTGLFMQFVALCTPTDDEEMLLELLVKKGALVDDMDAPGGRQPLHIAAMGNNCRLIRKLVELGAKVHAKNHRGETPKEFARLFKCKEATALLEEMDYFEGSFSSSDTPENSSVDTSNSGYQPFRRVTINVNDNK